MRHVTIHYVHGQLCRFEGKVSWCIDLGEVDALIIMEVMALISK